MAKKQAPLQRAERLLEAAKKRGAYYRAQRNEATTRAYQLQRELSALRLEMHKQKDLAAKVEYSNHLTRVAINRAYARSKGAENAETLADDVADRGCIFTGAVRDPMGELTNPRFAAKYGEFYADPAAERLAAELDAPFFRSGYGG